MTRIFKLIGVLVVSIGVILAGFAVTLRFSAGLQDTLLARGLDNAVGQAMALMREDATIPNAVLGGENLDVIFCGTASPMGGNDRAQSCIAIFAGPYFYLIDAGPRSSARLQQYALPTARLDGILLTHFHSDHIGGLGEIHLNSWAQGRKGKLAVYGGSGVTNVVDGFNEAYGLDFIYRSEHHGTAVMNPQDAGLKAQLIGTSGDDAVVVNSAGLRISAIQVSHDPIEPALGYVVSYKDRKLVVSGDTVAVDTVRAASRGADVLIHEALEPQLVELTSRALGKADNLRVARILRDTLDYHTSPAEAAEIANAANVPLLVLTHLAPVPANALIARVFRRNADAIRDAAGTVLADDGLFLRLPAGSKDIMQLRRD